MTESDLANVTGVDAYAGSNSGYYVVVADGEKFVTDVGAFAGYFIAPTYLPAQYPTCGPGTAYLYILGVNDAKGFFPDPSAPPSEDRRMTVGTGIPSKARVSAGVKSSDDKIYIQTSEGEVWTLQPPARDAGLDMIYWRQRL